MNPQEREVIGGIFDRLRSVESQPRDPEAERLIAELVAKQPYAPYAMAQAIYVQEQALKEFNDKVRDLEDQLKQTKSPTSSGSFLGGLFGAPRAEQPSPWSQPPRASVPQAGMGTAPQYGTVPPAGGFPPATGGGMFGGGGGGFLQGALGAAAGLAGGALLYQGLKGLFGHEGHGFGALGDQTGALDSPSPSSNSTFGDPSNMFRAASLQDNADDVDQQVDGDDVSDVGSDDSDLA